MHELQLWTCALRLLFVLSFKTIEVRLFSRDGKHERLLVNLAFVSVLHDRFVGMRLKVVGELVFERFYEQT